MNTRTSQPQITPPRPARRKWALVLHVLWRMVAASPPVPVRYEWFVPDEVARLDQALPAEPGRIDDATWRDMEMPPYVDLLAAELSIFGRQELVHRLRRGGSGAIGDLPYAWAQAEALAPAEAPALQRARAVLQPLRSVRAEVAALLFGPEPAALPPWAGWLWVLPLAVLAALALGPLVNWVLAGVALAATLVVGARAQIALHADMTLWHGQRSALCSLLQVALDLAQVERHTPHPRLAHAPGHAKEAQRLLQRLRPGWVERMPGVADYANLLWLHQVRLFGRQRAGALAERPALQTLYWHVAGLETDLALWRHLRLTPVHCAATPASAGNLVLQGVVHPLLADAQPLNLQLQQQGALITGQNGVGKSTLLRTVGLNVIVARAFGFCYAQSAQLPCDPAFTVVSSLQVEDSLQAATSLYMAELARARSLLQAVAQQGPVLVLIDEIFRGTNPQEAVAATTALAQALCAQALVLLCTHHVVLAPLLAAQMQAWCVQRHATGARTLQPGVLAQTNGLALLAEHGFDAPVQASAATVLAWLQGRLGGDAGAPPAGAAPGLTAP